MKFVLIATSIFITGGTSMTTLHSMEASAAAIASTETDQQVPTPKLQRTIDLGDIGSAVAVRKLSFSPDSRYLAIVVDPELGKTDIVVWDMVLGKKQSHIHCPYQYGVLADHDLLWNRDGKVISFGAKRQWDPMTGEALPDNPAIGRAARLNKDGTKMLTIVGAIGEPSYIYIYDTANWALQKLYVDGFTVDSVAWSAEDKIIVGSGLTHDLYSKSIDGYQPKNYHDVALRLLDPKGKEPTRTKWFPAKPTNEPKNPFEYSFPPGGVGTPDFPINKIFSAKGIIIDGKTLDVIYVPYFEGRGAFAMAFSHDGKLLYLRGESFKYGGHAPVTNSIVDIKTGKSLLQFGNIPEGGAGFATSSDGLSLALGLVSAVVIYRLQ